MKQIIIQSGGNAQALSGGVSQPAPQRFRAAWPGWAVAFLLALMPIAGGQEPIGEIIAAAQKVGTGAASSYDEALVLKNIKQIHQLKEQNRITDAHYQTVMAWHQSICCVLGRNAGEKTRLIVSHQRIEPTAEIYRSGSDIDFFVRRADGKPVTLEDVQAVERNFQWLVSEQIRKRSAASGKRLEPAPGEFNGDADFMPATDGTNEQEFARIARHFKEKGTDVYLRYAAAQVESQLRSGGQVTLEGGHQYVEEMQDQTARKQGKIDMLKGQLERSTGQAAVELQGQINILEYERNKYIARGAKVSAVLAAQAGAPPLEALAPGANFEAVRLHFAKTLGAIAASPAASPTLRAEAGFLLALRLHGSPSGPAGWHAFLETMDSAVATQVKVHLAQFSLLEKTREDPSQLERLRVFLEKTQTGKQMAAHLSWAFDELTKERSQTTSSAQFLQSLYSELRATGQQTGHLAMQISLLLGLAEQVRVAKTDSELAIAVGRTLASNTFRGLVASYIHMGVVEQDATALAKGLIILFCPEAAIPDVVRSIGASAISLTTAGLFDTQFMDLYKVARFDPKTGKLLGIGDIAGSDAACTYVDDIFKFPYSQILEGRLTSSVGGQALIKAILTTIYGGTPLVMADSPSLQAACSEVAQVNSVIEDFMEGLGFPKTVPLDVDASWRHSRLAPEAQNQLEKLLALRAGKWSLVKRALCGELRANLESQYQAGQQLDQGDQKALEMLAGIEQMFRDLNIYDLGMAAMEYEASFNFIQRAFFASTQEQKTKAMEVMLRYRDAYAAILALRESAESICSATGGGRLSPRLLTGAPPLTGDPAFDRAQASHFIQNAMKDLEGAKRHLLYLKREGLNDKHAELDTDFDKRTLGAMCNVLMRLHSCLTMLDLHATTRAEQRAKQITPLGIGSVVRGSTGSMSPLLTNPMTRTDLHEAAGIERTRQKDLVDEFKKRYESKTPELVIRPSAAIAEERAEEKRMYVFRVESRHVPEEAVFTWAVNGRQIGKGGTMAHVFTTAGVHRVSVVATWVRSARVLRDGTAEAVLPCLIGDAGSQAAREPALTIVAPPEVAAGNGITGKKYIFSLMPANIPKSATYSWFKGMEALGSGESIEVIFPEAGIVHLSASAKWAVAGDSSPEAVWATASFPLSQASPLVVRIEGPLTAKPNEEITLTAVVQPAAGIPMHAITSYTWNGARGQAESRKAVFKQSAPGEYAVHLEVVVMHEGRERVETADDHVIKILPDAMGIKITQPELILEVPGEEVMETDVIVVGAKGLDGKAVSPPSREFQMGFNPTDNQVYQRVLNYEAVLKPGERPVLQKFTTTVWPAGIDVTVARGWTSHGRFKPPSNGWQINQDGPSIEYSWSRGKSDDVVRAHLTARISRAIEREAGNPMDEPVYKRIEAADIKARFAPSGEQQLGTESFQEQPFNKSGYSGWRGGGSLHIPYDDKQLGSTEERKYHVAGGALKGAYYLSLDGSVIAEADADDGHQLTPAQNAMYSQWVAELNAMIDSIRIVRADKIGEKVTGALVLTPKSRSIALGETTTVRAGFEGGNSVDQGLTYEWANCEGDYRTTPATFKGKKIGPQTVSLRLKKGDKTVGLSWVDIDVTPPKMTIMLEPNARLVGQEWTARIMFEPAAAAELVDVNWDAGGAKILREGPGPHELRFRLENDKENILKATVMLKDGGGAVGTVERTVRAGKYMVEVFPPRPRGVAPMEWQGKGKDAGLKEVPRPLVSGSMADMECIVKPTPTENPIGYKWELVPADGCIAVASSSRSTTLQMNRPGSYTARVTIYDKNKTELGRGEISFEVVDDAPDRSGKQAKMDEARKAWAAGEIDKAVTLANEAQAANTKDEAIRREAGKMGQDRDAIKAAVREAETLLGRKKLADAGKKVEEALKLNGKYPPAMSLRIKLALAIKDAVDVWQREVRKAQTQFSDGDLSAAQATLATVLKETQESADIAPPALAGQAQDLQKKIETAIGQLKKAEIKAEEVKNLLQRKRLQAALAGQAELATLAGGLPGKAGQGVKGVVATLLANAQREYGAFVAMKDQAVKTASEKLDWMGAKKAAEEKREWELSAADETRLKEQVATAVRKLGEQEDAVKVAEALAQQAGSGPPAWFLGGQTDQAVRDLRAKQSLFGSWDARRARFDQAMQKLENRKTAETAWREAEQHLAAEDLVKAESAQTRSLTLHPNADRQRSLDNLKAANELWKGAQTLYQEFQRVTDPYATDLLEQIIAKGRESVRRASSVKRGSFLAEMERLLKERQAKVAAKKEADRLWKEAKDLLTDNGDMQTVESLCAQSVQMDPDPVAARKDWLVKLQNANKLWAEGKAQIEPPRDLDAGLAKCEESLSLAGNKPRFDFVESLKQKRTRAQDLRREGEALERGGTIPNLGNALEKYREGAGLWPNPELGNHINLLQARLDAMIADVVGSRVRKYIFDNYNKDSVFQGSAAPPSFTIQSAHLVEFICTYHWMEERGAAPGKIALRDQNGKMYGPWPARDDVDLGGRPDTNWIALPGITIPAGTYTVVDSDAATWSHNDPSRGLGFARVGAHAREEAQPVRTGMVEIPGGEFEMGDNRDYRHTKHTVSVSAFQMDKYEVTLGLWNEVYEWAIAHGYAFDSKHIRGIAPDHPVLNVSWYDALKWCNARSEKEGKTPAYYTGVTHTEVYRTGMLNILPRWVKWNAGYRLPTEAEWEKAGRGGLLGKKFPTGDTLSHDEANYSGHPVYGKPYGSNTQTSPVGSFAPNAYGLYDMAGNVWEMCYDCVDDYSYAKNKEKGTVTDPRGYDPEIEGDGRYKQASVRPNIKASVARGGSIAMDTEPWCNVGWRGGVDRGIGGNHHGFRTVLPGQAGGANPVVEPPPGRANKPGGSRPGAPIPASEVIAKRYRLERPDMTGWRNARTAFGDSMGKVGNAEDLKELYKEYPATYGTNRAIACLRFGENIFPSSVEPFVPSRELNKSGEFSGDLILKAGRTRYVISYKCAADFALDPFDTNTWTAWESLSKDAQEAFMEKNQRNLESACLEMRKAILDVLEKIELVPVEE